MCTFYLLQLTVCYFLFFIGLKCQSREQREWHGGRATKGVQGGGKYFYEALVTGMLKT